MKSYFILVALAACCAAKVIEPLARPVRPEHLHPSGRQGRINAGYQANKGQFPWQVLILSPISGTQSNVCGGAIISPTHVLTAAQCTRGFRSFNLRFGSVWFDEPLVTIETASRVEHEDYNPETLENDISIIFLPVDLPYNTQIREVQLPSRSQSSISFVLYHAVLSGFGRSSNSDLNMSMHLLCSNQRVISNMECTAIYGPNIVRSSTLCCVGWEIESQGGCDGDAGAPLVIDGFGEITLIAIVSFISSRGCGDVDPTGYTRLTSYLDWISERAGIEIRP